MGWIFANLFILCIILVEAGLLWACMFVVRWFELGDDIEPYALIFAAVISLTATYYILKRIYMMIDDSNRVKAKR